MFALVRFIDDIGNETRRYVVRVEDIEDFCPAHEADFDAKAVYFVHWTDKVDSANTGDYRAQILRLGATEQEARETSKRIRIPKLIVDDDYDDDEQASKKATNAARKKACNRAAAKKESYSRILRNQVAQAQQKISAERQRKQSTSSSGSDETIVSSAELEAAKREVRLWKQRCKELRADNVFLQEQVSSQQVLLQSKFLSLEDHQNRQMDLSNVPRRTAASQSTEEKTYSKIEPGPELFPAHDLQDYATATRTASSPQLENASDVSSAKRHMPNCSAG